MSLDRLRRAATVMAALLATFGGPSSWGGVAHGQVPPGAPPSPTVPARPPAPLAPSPKPAAPTPSASAPPPAAPPGPAPAPTPRPVAPAAPAAPPVAPPTAPPAAPPAATPAAAPRPAAPPAASPAASEGVCFPACREGFSCSAAGQCVAKAGQCYPACREGFACDASSTCVAVARPDAPGQVSSKSSARASEEATVSITSFESGEVQIDKTSATRIEANTPLVLPLSPGPHVLRILFDGGGRASKRVLALRGKEQSIAFEMPSTRADADRRLGRVIWGVGGHLGGLHSEGAHLSAVSFGAEALMSYGIAGPVDFQAILGVDAWGGPLLSVKVFAEPRLLFHLGSVFTMAVGLEVAGGFGTGGKVTGIGNIGVKASPAGFQFGSNRQHRLELTGELGGAFGDALRQRAFLRADDVHVYGGGDLRYSVMFQ